MTKRIALAVVVLASAVGTGYGLYPAEVTQYAERAADGARWAWTKVEANPLPVALAAGTFLLTVVYHKVRGKSLRESLAAAATRGAAQPVPPFTDDDSPVVRRAKARAMRTQLLADQIGLQNRLRKLPDELLKAEKETCYTEQALAEAERKFEARIEAHDEAVARLEALRKEKAEGDAELAGIDAELKRIAELV